MTRDPSSFAHATGGYARARFAARNATKKRLNFLDMTRVRVNVDHDRLLVDADLLKNEGQEGYPGLLNCSQSASDNRLPINIPLYRILSSNNHETTLHVKFCHEKTYRVQEIAIEQMNSRLASQLSMDLSRLLYGERGPRRRVRVLMNPCAGSGKALNVWKACKPMFEAAGSTFEETCTTHKLHAIEIAANLSLQDWDMVICVSGDGLVHEVINGFAKRTDARRALSMPIAMLPAGSGNALALNAYGSIKPFEVALSIVKGVVTALDLCSITQDSNRYISFLSTTFGVTADCDVRTEHLRWMGEFRFTYGIVAGILQGAVYPCDLALHVVLDDKDKIRKAYTQRNLEDYTELDNGPGLPLLKYGTVLDPVPADWKLSSHPCMGAYCAGNMPYMSSDACFFPAARPHDGLLDVMCIDWDISRWEALRTVYAVTTAAHFDSKSTYYAKVDAFRLIPCQSDGNLTIDGEKVSYSPVQVEVHRGLGRIIMKSGDFFTAW